MSKSKKQNFSIHSKNAFEKKLHTTTRKVGNVFFKSIKGFIEKQKKETAPSSEADFKSIIKSFENQNAAIAAASAAIPGPMGLSTISVETTKTMQNQLKMIYEISRSFQKDNLVNKDILLDIPLQALGKETDLPNIQNISKDELVESKQKEIKEKSRQLARVMLEKTLKKSVVRSLPIIGPVVMSYFAKKNTRKIGETAVNFFNPNYQK